MESRHPLSAAPLAPRGASAKLAFALSFLALGVLVGACGGAQTPSASAGGFDVAGDLVERADINGDGRPDMVRTYIQGKEPGQKILVKSQVDLNFDGRPDKVSYFDPQSGKLQRVELNWDFDKSIDAINYYDQDGQLEVQKIDRDFDGRFDTEKRFKGGLLYSRKIDTNSDGKYDLWEYYTKRGKIFRIGKDLDGDGKPEYFEDLRKAAKK